MPSVQILDSSRSALFHSIQTTVVISYASFVFVRRSGIKINSFHKRSNVLIDFYSECKEIKSQFVK